MKPADLLREYEKGVGFRYGDTLRPKVNVNIRMPCSLSESVVVVLQQDSLVPHQYTVIGERAAYTAPSDRFVKFIINGHDWEKIGAAK